MSRGEVWRIVSITMLQGWRERLMDACRRRDFRIIGTKTGPTQVVVYVETTRTVEQTEDDLRAQLQFDGWMAVEEELP